MPRMRSSTKHGTEENSRDISAQVASLHQRLYHSLNIGSLESRGKWTCSDIGTQRLILRSIAAFIQCISNETLRHPLVKDSIKDIVGALQSILESKNSSVLILATNVAVNFIRILPSSALQSHVLKLACPVAKLLFSKQLEVAIACATSINVILSKLSPSQEREMWEIFRETKALGHVVCHIKLFDVNDSPVEYFLEMASVLNKAMWLWSSSRFSVWSDTELLGALDIIKFLPQYTVKVAILQVYSSLALCRCGSERLLENGHRVLQMMVDCLGSSTATPVRMEALKLATCLALSQKGCRKMMKMCSLALVKAVIGCLSSQYLPSGKLDDSVVLGACRLASIICSIEDHHMHFLKSGIIECLFDFCFDNCVEIHQKCELSNHDLITLVQKSYKPDTLLSFGPYIWNLLGGFAANFSEIGDGEMDSKEYKLKALIICACISFVDSMGTLRHISQYGSSNLTNCESVSRAMLKMLYTSCKHIATFSKLVLCEILKLDGKNYVEYLVDTLNIRLAGKNSVLSAGLHIVIILICLACYCCLPLYQEIVVKFQGLKTVVALTLWWIKNPAHTKRTSIVPFFHDSFLERSCCYANTEMWEGEGMSLFFSLWILAELLQDSSLRDTQFFDKDISEAYFIQKPQHILRGCYSHGVKWYASYTLKHFGIYGFPSKLGDRIGKLLGEKEHADVKLVVANQESVFAHEPILAVRCPSLFPPGKLTEKFTSPTMEVDVERNSMNTVHLSARVNHQSLTNLLEYAYSGHTQVSVDHLRDLRLLAKSCKLEYLIQLLSKGRPLWGTSIPTFDLKPALYSPGCYSSDLILEATSTSQLVDQKCEICSCYTFHIHVHKVIVASSCGYLRALFQSGMQDCHSRIVAVPISSASLTELVNWFYSYELSKPAFDCSWQHSATQTKVLKVQTYLELCWLAEFWLIDDLQEECYEAVVSCLDFSKDLSIKIIQLAANLSQWKVVQVAADHMAPSFHLLRDSGELDQLDEHLVEIVRTASVRLSRDQCSKNQTDD